MNQWHYVVRRIVRIEISALARSLLANCKVAVVEANQNKAYFDDRDYKITLFTILSPKWWENEDILKKWKAFLTTLLHSKATLKRSERFRLILNCWNGRKDNCDFDLLHINLIEKMNYLHLHSFESIEMWKIIFGIWKQGSTLLKDCHLCERRTTSISQLTSFGSYSAFLILERLVFSIASSRLWSLT